MTHKKAASQANLTPKHASPPSIQVSSLDHNYSEFIKDSPLKLHARKASLPVQYSKKIDPIMNIAQYELNKINKGIKKAQQEISANQSRNVETLETTTRHVSKSSNSKDTSWDKAKSRMMSKSPSSPSISNSLKYANFKSNLRKGNVMAPTPVHDVGGIGLSQFQHDQKKELEHFIQQQ